MWYILRADSGPPRMSTIAPRDQFNPIRVGENLVVNFNELYGQLRYGCTREVAKNGSRRHNQFWILSGRSTIGITKWRHFSRMYWIRSVQWGFENRQCFQCFSTQKCCSILKSIFPWMLHPTYQKVQEWLIFITYLMMFDVCSRFLFEASFSGSSG